jgi:hypothetical protein
MTKKNIKVVLWGSGRTTMLQARGGRGFDDVAGSETSRGRWCCRIGEDDGTAGPGMAWVDGIAGSGRTMALQA